MSYKIYSGTGTVYMAPVNSSGVKTGDFTKVGDAYPLSVQVSTKQFERKSRMVERAGQIIASKTEIDTINGSLTLHEWNAKNLAWAVSGSAAAMTGTGASVTDEAVTAPAAGEYVQLGGTTPRRNISAVTVTTSPAGTTYDVTDDYELDTTLGLLTITSTGDISEDDALLVSYTYAAESDQRVSIGTSVQIRVAILAHLYDEYRQEHYIMELDSAVLASSSEINFISDEDSDGEPLQFSMVLETLSGQTSPGRIDGVPL